MHGPGIFTPTGGCAVVVEERDLSLNGSPVGTLHVPSAGLLDCWWTASRFTVGWVCGRPIWSVLMHLFSIGIWVARCLLRSLCRWWLIGSLTSTGRIGAVVVGVDCFAEVGLNLADYLSKLAHVADVNFILVIGVRLVG